ncbi:unnamed protein product [Enterobius vermicularis]|uniref:Tetratricopeptide repeat protein 21B n=1 Tax=Enterobius vermicularis TaxID=51028 RepID=A0A0N4VE44_ENTVE|nr:unnamed protein product [Enterobius vermicularis]
MKKKVDGKTGQPIMEESETMTYLTVLYYIRSKFYGSATLYCDTALKNCNDDPQLLLFRAICLIFDGQFPLAIRMFEEQKQNEDLRLAVLYALKQAHNSTKVPDIEAIREIDKEIETMSATASEENMFNAAIICHIFGMNSKAYDLIEKAVIAAPDSAQTNCLRGWIWLSENKDTKIIFDFFENALKQGYPDAYLGKAKLLERRHNITEACQVLALLLNKMPSFLPALIEYTKTLFTNRVWGKIEEQVQRILIFQPDCVPAHLIQTIHAIAIEGKPELIWSSLEELQKVIAFVEPSNDCLYFDVAQLLARICENGGDHTKLANKFLEKAIEIDRKPEYLAEKMRILVLEKDVKGARAIAMEVLQMEPPPLALLGLVKCLIHEDRISEAISQMQFVTASHPKIVEDSNQTFGIDYIRELDSALLINVVEELFVFAPLMPVTGGDQTLKEIARILTFIHTACPGLVYVEYLLAKTKYLSMETESTELLLQACLTKDSNLPEAHLLMAQIKIQKGDYADAEKCLSLGLSFNFNMQYHPLYQLIKAKIQKNAQQYEASVETLRSALKMESFVSDGVLKRGKLDVTDTDRISIYLELIDSLQKLGRLAEANNHLMEATNRWNNKLEGQQLMLMDAKLRLQQHDVDGALSILIKIPPDQQNYSIARMQMADIYLNYKKDKKKFVECYRQLIEIDQSSATYVLLGDAYMNIQEPVKAIEVYETALKLNPRDDILAEKIGEAYILCHLYSKAVNYYETALKSGRREKMRIRLAKLLIQLKNYTKCEKILRQVLTDSNEINDVTKMTANVEFRMLLATVLIELGKVTEAITELNKANITQKRIIEKPSGELIDMDEQKSIAAKILSELASLHLSQREVRKAVELYEESIALSTRNIRAMLSLASLYKALGRTANCRKQCENILDIEPSNTEAMLLLADLSYEKNEGDIATERFAQILEQDPNQYHVLCRYIELRWRRGDVKNAQKFLKAALEANPRATTHAGFNYCKGLYHSYIDDPNGALQAFNRARRDLEWGERATYNMIGICLNPDNEFISGDSVENSTGGEISKINSQDVRREMGERFLKDLQVRPTLDPNYKIVEQFIMLQHNDRNVIQQALKNFLEIAGPENGEVQSVPALYGSAKAYAILKQTHKAKAQLKKVLDRNWTIAEADVLEKCWVMLADIYIAQNKTDQATSVLRTLLRYNESSVKGFECMGKVHEQGQRWSDAAANYEMAWQLTNRQQPAIGFKLAFCYLKAKKLFDCIDVCHQVLASYPNYPTLKKNIMDKARSLIRI